MRYADRNNIVNSKTCHTGQIKTLVDNKKLLWH